MLTATPPRTRKPQAYLGAAVTRSCVNATVAAVKGQPTAISFDQLLHSGRPMEAPGS